MIPISKNLILLAEIFSKKTTLYLIGGCVRNSLLGIDDLKDDYDITSPLSTWEVEEILAGTHFRILSSVRRLGTLVIENILTNEKYEYTCFREDTYRIGSGQHSPISVSFTRDINIDAARRDFTCNAIYYDILKGSFVDPLHGIKSMMDGVIVTTRDPKIVFAEDPLRMLRMVRQACELGFKPSPESVQAIKDNAHLLVGITRERKRDELNRIIASDTRYKDFSKPNSHVKGLEYLIELNLMEYILPGFTKLEGIVEKGYKNNLLYYAKMAYKYAPLEVRIPALLHNIGKKECLLNNNNTYGYDIVGERICYDLLGEDGLLLSKPLVKEISRLVRISAYNLQMQAKETKVRHFIVENIDNIKLFLAIREAMAKAYEIDLDNNYEYYNQYQDLYSKMQDEKVPFKLKDLLVNGQDCIDLGLAGEDISKVLNTLLKESINNPALRNKEGQIGYIKKYSDRILKKDE